MLSWSQSIREVPLSMRRPRLVIRHRSIEMMQRCILKIERRLAEIGRFIRIRDRSMAAIELRIKIRQPSIAAIGPPPNFRDRVRNWAAHKTDVYIPSNDACLRV